MNNTNILGPGRGAPPAEGRTHPNGHRRAPSQAKEKLFYEYEFETLCLGSGGSGGYGCRRRDCTCRGGTIFAGTRTAAAAAAAAAARTGLLEEQNIPARYARGPQ